MPPVTPARVTPEGMREQAKGIRIFAQWALSHWHPNAQISKEEANGLLRAADALGAGADAIERWEQLKASVRTRLFSIDIPVDDLLAEMTRLECEP